MFEKFLASFAVSLDGGNHPIPDPAKLDIHKDLDDAYKQMAEEAAREAEALEWVETALEDLDERIR